MKKKYLIMNLADKGYYCSYPDGYSFEITEAISFDSEYEAHTRIMEIIRNGQALAIVPYFVKITKSFTNE